MRLVAVRSFRCDSCTGTAQMNSAASTNDAESIMNAASVPSVPATTPPSAAPIASIADHVAPLIALAAISSSRLTTSGVIAVRAGSKNDTSDILHTQKHARVAHLP